MSKLIRVPDKAYKRLKLLSKLQDVSMSYIIDRLTLEQFKKYKTDIQNMLKQYK